MQPFTILSILLVLVLCTVQVLVALPDNYVYTIETLLQTSKDVHSITYYLGDVYYSQQASCNVYKLDKTTGKSSVYAGKGCTTAFLTDYGDGQLAVNAYPSEFHDMTMDKDGNLFISDTKHSVIRRVDYKTKIITRVAGTYESPGFSVDGTAAINATINLPEGIRHVNGTIYFVDYINNRIRRFKDDGLGLLETVGGSGKVSYGTGNGDGGKALLADMGPLLMDVDTNGDVYFMDDAIKTVRKISSSTGLIHTIASGGTEGFKYTDGMSALDVHIWPASVTVLNGGKDVLVTSTGTLYQFTFDSIVSNQPNYKAYLIAGLLEARTYQYNGDNILANEATLDGPTTTLLMPDGSILVADTDHARIRKLVPGNHVKRAISSANSMISYSCLCVVSSLFSLLLWLNLLQ